MTQTITLNLPDAIYDPIRRTAQATNQPLEAVLVTALEASLPSLEGLPGELRYELVGLETLNNSQLWQVMLETVPPLQQEALETLLAKNQERQLTEAERGQLDDLQQAADRVMLRKARAAVLLRFRGHRLPTLAELRQLTSSPR